MAVERFVRLLRPAVATCVFAASTCAGHAQTETSPSKVDEGSFRLQVGRSIDITNKRYLLSLVELRSARRGINISLNGQRMKVDAGERLDLNRMFKMERRECFLDVLDRVAPDGSPPSVGFRLSCY